MTRVCVVSGAASGIGRATLEVFLSQGYSCVGIDSDGNALDRLLSDLAPRDRERVELVKVDLLDDDELALAPLGELEGKGTQLTLVNNLGGSRAESAPLGLDTWTTFAEVLAFNLKPLHTLTRACLGTMKESQYGRIVNVSSVSARRPLEQVTAAYASAKAAVIGLSRHLAVELAGDNILVNTVCPGVIGTERIERRWSSRTPELNRALLREIPLKRLGAPEEVAAAIYFLGSTSTYTTGCILDVNGGLHMP